MIFTLILGLLLCSEPSEATIRKIKKVYFGFPLLHLFLGHLGPFGPYGGPFGGPFGPLIRPPPPVPPPPPPVPPPPPPIPPPIPVHHKTIVHNKEVIKEGPIGHHIGHEFGPHFSHGFEHETFHHHEYTGFPHEFHHDGVGLEHGHFHHP
ncbi:unnamed protein product [Acanthoscelides obtectus]|uniref:Uncharacterized protein n=1 Tax=Acanthoscelides obtectus TaxID=200917 RepID=A0A9P0JVB1_ACAOB|nr:unnamed protein product [Acanthoscelides obtectus]CAK1661767.1 hypothetical protein AOBTE_LOCUS22787 [Acanthoscelides obtectus]